MCKAKKKILIQTFIKTDTAVKKSQEYSQGTATKYK